MIQKSQAFMDAWLNGKQKLILLSFSDSSTLDDESVVSESFSLTQSLCEEDQLCFGLTSSAMCSVQIMNTGKQYKGLDMTVQMSAVDDEENYYVMDLGTYKIESDVRSDDRLYRTLTGYDALYGVLNADYSDFYNSYMGSSRTLKQFRDAFFSHIGVVQETATLPQDSLTLVKKPNVTSLSGADIIRGICEINAAFGFINYDGKFQYSIPTQRSRSFPANDLYPSNSLYPSDGADITLDGDDVESAPIMGGLIYSDYFTHKITGAEFARTENTPSASAGTSTNVYQFRDSILMYGQTTSTLQGICSAFVNATSDFFYNPGRVTGRARVWAQLGDVLRASTDRDSIVIPILKRTMSGVTALYDTYEANGTEYYTYSPNRYEAQHVEQTTAISEVNEYVAEVEEQVEEVDKSWRSSVSASMDVWDEGEYVISFRDFGDPVAESYELSDVGKLYLDEETGKVYTLESYSSGGETLLRWVFTAQLGTTKAAIQSEIAQSAHTISLSVTGAASKQTGASITITLKDANGNIISNGSGNVLIDGNVIFSSQLTDGVTTISGSNITTGYISADRISGGTLEGVDIKAYNFFILRDTSNRKDLYFTYTYSSAGYNRHDLYIGSSQMSANATINVYRVSATSGMDVGGYSVITAANIGSQSVSYATSAGSASSASYATSAGSSTVSNYAGMLGSGSYYIYLSGSNNIIPSSTSIKCGTRDNYFDSMAATVFNTVSDKKLKNHIKSLGDDREAVDFIMSLTPVAFSMKDDDSNALRLGFYAQDVYQSAKVFNAKTNIVDVAYKETDIPCEDVDNEDDNNLSWTMNYSSLIAPLVTVVQTQQKEIDSLKSEVAELKAMLKEVLNVGKQE